MTVTIGASPLTAQDMRALVYRHYAGRCAVLFEISKDFPEAGAAPGQPKHRTRRIDALTVARARRQNIGPLDLMAIEIKVSRADFLADLRDPAKQAGWREIAHRHAYAMPEGVAEPDEIPAGSGLLVAPADGYRRLGWVRKAPYSTTPELGPWFTLSLAWRMSAAEAKTRGLTDLGLLGDAQTADDLRGQVAHLRAELDKARNQADRHRTERDAWRQAYAATGGLPCEHCGQPVKPTQMRRGHFSEWRHLTRAHEAGCADIRLAKGRWVEITPADDAEPMIEVAR